ncbi:MAG: nitroreductase family protein [Erysipelotrichaceae bacterium]|nr:nitroreductase family protein [Erysipelotrichaceae bacterium]
METNQSIIETMKIRTSVRTYDGQAIAADTLEKLNERLRTINATTTIKARFILGEMKDTDGNAVKKLGTYGVITGARTYLVGIIDQSETDAVQFGYLFESIVLYATQLGLGTCWLGGTFNQEDFKKIVRLGESEKIVIVSPVGYRKDRATLMEGIMRTMVKANNRKPWTELFFNQDKTQTLDEEGAGGYAIPLEMVRLAPSASNKQPWRVLRSDTGFHFYLCRTKGYGSASYDVQMNDLGIAKYHFEKAADELGLSGKWDKIDHPVVEEWEYVTSWQGR